MKKHVVSFSGGRTSGFMLRSLQERHGSLDDWVVMFANTGKERDETLEFVHAVETVWGIPVVWVQYDRIPASQIDLESVRKGSQSHVKKQQEAGEDAHWYKIVTYETAHRNGQPDSPFDKLLDWMRVLPNPTSRGCTAELKIRAMARYLWSQGITSWVDYIGIRFDELDRAAEIKATSPKYIQPEFPLVEWRIAVGDVMEFWKEQAFDLNLKPYEGNCDLCFLKSQGKRIRLMRENPGMADWWIEWERKKVRSGNQCGNRFREEQSYTALQYMAKHPRLFDIDDPEFGGPDGGDGCACMTLGYKELENCE